MSYSCKCSFFEIFNEKVFDLVDESNRDNPMGLTVREDTRKGVYVEGLMEEDVSWVTAVVAIMGVTITKKVAGTESMRERERELYEEVNWKDHRGNLDGLNCR